MHAHVVEEGDPAVAGVGPDEPHPLNLFRVHWYNGADRRTLVEVPDHLVLGPEVVVEVEYNEIQKSPTYPSGFALRFARIARRAPSSRPSLLRIEVEHSWSFPFDRFER